MNCTGRAWGRLVVYLIEGKAQGVGRQASMGSLGGTLGGTTSRSLAK